MKIWSGNGKRKAGRSALEKGMVACIVLTLVSSLFFVGTTLSWFSDTVGVGGTVIRTGDFAVQMVITDSAKSGRMNVTSENGTVLKQVIQLTRQDKEDSDVWEPGAVFASNEIYVENTGELDLEYRLELLTSAADILSATQSGQTDSTDLSGLALSEVVEFKIVNYQDKYSDAEIEEIFKNEAVDQRTTQTDPLVSTAEELGVRSLAAATDKNTPTKGGSFRILGRMKDDADEKYKGLTFSTPFILVLHSQQAGSEWAADTTVTLCTEDKHKSLIEAQTNENLYIDTQSAYWRYEKDAENSKTHVYHCANCDGTLLAKTDTEWHAAVAAKLEADHTDTGSVWVVTVSDTQTDYYCRVCGARIATRAVDEAGSVTWTTYD